MPEYEPSLGGLTPDLIFSASKQRVIGEVIDTQGPAGAKTDLPERRIGQIRAAFRKFVMP
jgi:hypothetical protein